MNPPFSSETDMLRKSHLMAFIRDKINTFRHFIEQLLI